MNADESLRLLLGLLGGLALFIYGMRAMSAGLAAACGDNLRRILAAATRNRFAGLGLGTAVGGLVQSSATIVLLIGFINAGLMTFSQSIAPMLGANIGTTLSIQLISFKLADYCLAGVFLGLVFSLIGRSPRLKHGGEALLGFGLLFLGMTLMGDAIRPHRELFEPWLAHINGATTQGLVLGALVAMLITGIIQSSGAVIGMAFAMVSAGAIHDLQGIFPIVIGANVGTCVTGLLGSIGTTIEARRAAVAHLLFNLLSTALAIAAAPLFYTFIPHTSADVIRQAANADTIKMLLSALLCLPLAPLLGKLTVWVTPTKKLQPEPSFLDPAILNRPEQAIYASLRELQRSARICARSLRLAAEEFLQHDPRRERIIRANEEAINAVKLALRDYLVALTRQYLSRRQAILIEHIDRCMSDLERMGDHIENMVRIAARQRQVPEARFGVPATEDWLALHHALSALMEQVIASLDPETADFQAMAKQILDRHESFAQTALAAQQSHFKRLEEKSVTPVAGMHFYDYLSNFWRIAKHIKSIALAEQQPQFWLKREKLGMVMSGGAPGYALPGEINPKDYLDRLQSNGLQ